MIGKNISRYRILGQVGEGGMGVVYVAEDTVLRRRVAIKIPHAGKDESHYRTRFLREAQAVSKLRHENIAAVHDYGETEDGQPFIVMELVSGQTLGELLSGPGISVARAVEVARQTAEALSEAHRLGVIHRDIKPSNVVINEAGVVKVLDFGLAKQLHEEGANGAGGPEAQTLLTARTRSDVVIGTPLYLSPEQARGAKVDGRSDLFALGALLYECLTGRPAFSGANVIEIGAQVLHFDPPPPSRLNGRVPSELDKLTLKALSKKPEDRFQTAADFAAELRRVGARLPDSDTVTTRRAAGADNNHRSSALITMAEGLRRPKFSLLALVGALAALGLLIWLVAYVRRPSVHVPGPEVSALYESGVAALREGAYYKASRPLQEAVEKDAEFVLAHARLAEALMEMDFLDRAKDEMLDVGRRAPDFSVFPREDALYLGAVYAAVMPDHAGAVKGYQEIVKLDPTRPQAHLDLGRAYERNNEPDKALESYTQATTLDRTHAVAFLRLGALHARKLNQPAATVAFDSAQKLYADRGNREGEAAVHYQRGRLFFNLQKTAEARAELERSLALARDTDNKYQQVLALLQLAQVIPVGAEAEKMALEAIGVAQATGMNDQLANGHITLGNVHFLKLNDRGHAERDYNQALQIARNFKLRRYEAIAYFNLASLREQEGKFDEADQLAERARDFFLQGGYRREADQYSMITARSKKGRGDYEGALKIFRELLGSAEQSGDTGQAGNLHRECGAVFYMHQKYPEALAHFRESGDCARTLKNANMLTYSLFNQANMLWALGHYEEAGAIYGQLTGADPHALGVNRQVLAYIQMADAEMELSRHNFPAAGAKARRAQATFNEWNGQNDDLLSEIHSTLGLAETFGGARARGRALCEEGVRLASVRNDPATVAFANFALAQALLEAGDAEGARAAALRAQEVFTSTRRGDSEWRALAVAGKASRRAADEDAARTYLSRAQASLAQFEQSLGAEATGYLSRPDVQRLRGELGVSTASADH
jgi:tetratricopeptide (TPR) repeat protein/tRNA A-37 threonylcarbamoyl transferase component Bud32